MTPEDYNRKQMESGEFTDEAITHLVFAWQESVGLESDGKCGPRTQRSITQAMVGINPYSSKLGLLAVHIAAEEIGKGEEGGNNSGPHVAKYHGIKDDNDPDDDGSWCSSFVGWCYMQAAERAGVELPFKRSGGAKRFYRNIGEAGSFPSDPAPGDVICWDRGRRGSWKGHLALIEKVSEGIVYTIEGNVGSYPSKVRRFMHDLSRESRIEGFGRPPKIEGE